MSGKRCQKFGGREVGEDARRAFFDQQSGRARRTARPFAERLRQLTV